MNTTNRPHRSIFAGVLGAIALVGGLAAVSINASADSPALVTSGDNATTTTTVAPSEPDGVDDASLPTDEEPWLAYETCMEETGVYDAAIFDENDGGELTDEEQEAIDAAYEAADAECQLLLPEEIRIENAAWEAFSECIDDTLGPDFWEEDAWDDDEYQAADLACRSVLPEDIQAEMAAHDAFAACQSELVDEVAFNGQVSIDRFDAYDSFAFGEGDATITITKVDGEVTVSVDGDVIVQDDAYWEAQEKAWIEAEEACSHLLPEYD